MVSFLCFDLVPFLSHHRYDLSKLFFLFSTDKAKSLKKPFGVPRLEPRTRAAAFGSLQPHPRILNCLLFIYHLSKQHLLLGIC